MKGLSDKFGEMNSESDSKKMLEQLAGLTPNNARNQIIGGFVVGQILGNWINRNKVQQYTNQNIQRATESNAIEKTIEAVLSSIREAYDEMMKTHYAWNELLPSGKELTFCVDQFNQSYTEYMNILYKFIDECELIDKKSQEIESPQQVEELMLHMKSIFYPLLMETENHLDKLLKRSWILEFAKLRENSYSETRSEDLKEMQEEINNIGNRSLQNSFVKLQELGIQFDAKSKLLLAEGENLEKEWDVISDEALENSRKILIEWEQDMNLWYQQYEKLQHRIEKIQDSRSISPIYTSQNTSEDPEARIQKLVALKNKELITLEEFELKKKEILRDL